MKNFDLREFQEVINRVNPVFKKLENTQFENINFANNIVATDIKYIYDQLKKIAEQTGASKIMALKNSKLFVMWDTEIRKIYKIKNKANGDDYLKFLKEMKNRFSHLKSPNKKTSLAKAIDEYNYVIAEKRRVKTKNRRLSKKSRKINL